MILQAANIKSGYARIPVLFGVDLSLTKGECVGVWGHNGMGKSTLLSTLMGHLPLTYGTIQFCGENVTHRTAHLRARAGLGLVPQGRQIFSSLSVRENIEIGCVSHTNLHANVLDELLDLFPRLKSLLPRLGGQLSGGEQQLLALARCLAGRPKLIMLDEPTEGIQPSINDEIAVVLDRLRTEKQLSIIIVEQKREFLAALTNRILVMQKGVIGREMSAAELLKTTDLE
jgi:branched-chain amino acid transport system ATP-binding protein